MASDRRLYRGATPGDHPKNLPLPRPISCDRRSGVNPDRHLKDRSLLAGDFDEPALLDAVRGGSVAAYALLYQHHRSHAVRYARRVAADNEGVEVDDVVETAFTRAFAALRNGKGPTDTLRYYLFVAIRNEIWAARSKVMRERRTADRFAVDEPIRTSAPPEPSVGSGPDGLSLGGGLVAGAFARLPDRWRNLLWMTEVEGFDAAEVGAVMGISPNAASALAFRARGGLRREYVQLYRETEMPPGCHTIAARLTEFIKARDTSTGFDDVHAHLDGCASCRDVVRGVDVLAAGLRSLAPIGVLTSGAWAASLGPASSGPAGGSAAETVELRPCTRPRWRHAATVVGAAAVVILGLVIGFGDTSGTPPGRGVDVTTVAVGPADREASPTRQVRGPADADRVVAPATSSTTSAPTSEAGAAVPAPPTTAPSSSTVPPPDRAVPAATVVRGSIRTGSSVGLSGVPVRVVPIRGGPALEARSGPGGRWTIAEVPPGRYDVIVLVPVGYAIAGSAPGPASTVHPQPVSVGQRSFAEATTTTIDVAVEPVRTLGLSGGTRSARSLANGGDAWWDFEVSSANGSSSSVDVSFEVRYPEGADLAFRGSGGRCEVARSGGGHAAITCRLRQVGAEPSPLRVEVSAGAVADGQVTIAASASTPQGIATAAKQQGEPIALRP